MSEQEFNKTGGGSKGGAYIDDFNTSMKLYNSKGGQSQAQLKNKKKKARKKRKTARKNKRK